jgi:hypothetical protein
MNVRLAPSWRAAAVRSLLLLGTVILIAAMIYLIDGAPTIVRKSRFDELVLFAPSLGRGLSELVTETFVLIGVTWLCRDGLKVRL